MASCHQEIVAVVSYHLKCTKQLRGINDPNSWAQCGQGIVICLL